MKTSEVLLETASTIERQGWATGNGWGIEEPAGSPVCLEGAMALVLGVEDGIETWGSVAHSAFTDYIGGQKPYRWNDLQMWEDGNPRHGYRGGSRDAALVQGAEQVTAALRACALIEAAREDAAVAAREHAAEGVSA